MHTLIEFAVLGLGTGGVYGLLGNGLVLIYRGSGLVNFAHGAMAMAGAYLFYEFAVVKGWEHWLAFLVSVALLALIGVATQLVLMRRLRDASPISRLIGTLGILAVLDGGFSKWFGSTTNTVVPPLLPNGSFTIGAYGFSEQALSLLGIGLIICVGLSVWSKRSASGLAMMAVAESPEAASGLGWSPQVVATATWTAGAALAGASGILIAPTTGLVLTNMTLIVVAALAAAMLGGFESFPIVFAAGVVIGIVQSEMARYISTPGWSDSLPFLVIGAALIIRGRGLPVRGHVMEELPRLGSGVVPLRTVIPITILISVCMLTVFSQNLTIAITVQVAIALILLSVVVVTGFAGQLSLAQYALAGVGAYVSGRLAAVEHWPFLLCLLAGVLGAAAAGLAIGAPALRTRGVNLAIVTLGLGVALQDLVFLNPSYTGGIDGTTVPAPSVFGISINPIVTPGRYAIFCCVCLVLATLIVANVRRSRAGRRMIAVRANERAAASLGVSVTGAKLYAFSLAAAIAGLGGALLAFQNPVLDFSQFDPLSSVNFVGFATIGGIGHLLGPLFGSGFQDGGVGSVVLNSIGGLDSWLPLIGGIVIIVVLMQNPDGVAGTPVPRLLGRALKAVAWLGRPPSPAQPAELADGVAQPTAAKPRRKPDRMFSLPGPELGPMVRRDGETLVVSNMTVRFGGVVAVDAVSLSVAPGEIVGLIGPNGAGKTTFIDAITGFVPANSGEVSLGDQVLGKLPPFRRARLGVIRTFQSLELFEDFTAWDNFQIATDSRDQLGYLSGLLRPGRRLSSPSAIAAIRSFGLENDLKHFPRDLPYGTRRLLGIARAVACSPNTLLLDEPAAGLDHSDTAHLASLLRALAKERGMGILLVEHDMTLVMDVCDRIVVLEFGQVIGAGTPAEIRADPAVIEAYLGFSEKPELAGADTPRQSEATSQVEPS